MTGPTPEAQDAFRKTFLLSLRRGEIRSGVVTGIQNFGVFVDIGGVDGMVNVAELTWKHINHPGEVVEIGQRVDVEVLDIDMDRERIALSLKATQDDPWRHFAQTRAPGQTLPGTVTKLVPFGAFVRIADGIEGLVHITELAGQHVELPNHAVQVGDRITVQILDLDLQRRRILLSLRRTTAPPDAPA